MGLVEVGEGQGLRVCCPICASPPTACLICPAPRPTESVGASCTSGGGPLPACCCLCGAWTVTTITSPEGWQQRSRAKTSGLRAKTCDLLPKPWTKERSLCVSAGKDVGRGGFGSVCLAYSLHDGRTLAAKTVRTTTARQLAAVHQGGRGRVRAER